MSPCGQYQCPRSTEDQEGVAWMMQLLERSKTLRKAIHIDTTLNNVVRELKHF